MQFKWNDQMVHLQSIAESSVDEVSSKQLTCLQSTNSISEFYQLKVHTPEDMDNANQPPIPYII